MLSRNSTNKIFIIIFSISNDFHSPISILFSHQFTWMWFRRVVSFLTHRICWVYAWSIIQMMAVVVSVYRNRDTVLIPPNVTPIVIVRLSVSPMICSKGLAAISSGFPSKPPLFALVCEANPIVLAVIPWPSENLQMNITDYNYLGKILLCFGMIESI